METQIRLAMARWTFVSNLRKPIPWLSWATRVFQHLHSPLDNVRETATLTMIGTSNLLHGICCSVPWTVLLTLLFHSAPGLSCFQRAREEAVPGCSGNGATGYDYCHNPAFIRSKSVGINDGTLPKLDFIGDREMELYSLQECQGDCDFDSGKKLL